MEKILLSENEVLKRIEDVKIIVLFGFSATLILTAVIGYAILSAIGLLG